MLHADFLLKNLYAIYQNTDLNTIQPMPFCNRFEHQTYPVHNYQYLITSIFHVPDVLLIPKNFRVWFYQHHRQHTTNILPMIHDYLDIFLYTDKIF